MFGRVLSRVLMLWVLVQGRVIRDPNVKLTVLRELVRSLRSSNPGSTPVRVVRSCLVDTALQQFSERRWDAQYNGGGPWMKYTRLAQ